MAGRRPAMDGMTLADMEKLAARLEKAAAAIRDALGVVSPRNPAPMTVQEAPPKLFTPPRAPMRGLSERLPDFQTPEAIEQNRLRALAQQAALAEMQGERARRLEQFQHDDEEDAEEAMS